MYKMLPDSRGRIELEQYACIDGKCDINETLQSGDMSTMHAAVKDVLSVSDKS